MGELAALEIVAVKLILVSLILFAILWGAKQALKNVPLRKAIRSHINRIFPMLEGIVWLGFMLWCIGQLVQNELWKSIGVVIFMLLVVLLLFWLVVRDYMAGIILKIDGSVKLNDWIRVSNFEGKIIELGSRTMVVSTDSGETINIPYSAISGEISAKPNPGEEVITHSFILKLAKTIDAENSMDQIKTCILNAPWSSVNKLPEIKLVDDFKDYYQYEINIYSLQKSYFQKIKEYLVESLNRKGLKPLD